MISLEPGFPYDVERNTWPWRPTPYIKPERMDSAVLPKISIVTPSFNQGAYIEETIRSVFLQGYPNLEYIIIDGGSTDGTLEIIKKYEPWLAYWESIPDRGQSHAINKGIERANGDWVAWLNTDDIYLQGALFKVALTIVQSPEPVSWVVGTTIMTDSNLSETGQFPPSLYTAPGRDVNYVTAGWVDFVSTKRSGIALPQPSSFWKRDAVNQVGGIDETLQYAMDHELYGRMARQGFRPVLIEEALACFRTHHQQKTSNFPIAFWNEELMIVHNWESRVNGIERQKLESYGRWLNVYIKSYPCRSFLHNSQIQFMRILKSRFGSIYNWLKNYYRKADP